MVGRAVPAIRYGSVDAVCGIRPPIEVEQVGGSYRSPVAESFHVRIAKAEHVFSAAHFITFDGNLRTAAWPQLPCRGRNRRPAGCESPRRRLSSGPGQAPRDHAELDHYMLLPTKHPEIRVDDNGREVTVTFADRRWVFPSGDCRLLPVANTTAELLAAHIGKRLLTSLGRRRRKDRTDSRRTRRVRRSARRLELAKRLGRIDRQNLPNRHFFSSTHAFLRRYVERPDCAPADPMSRLITASNVYVATCPTSTTPPCCS